MKSVVVVVLSWNKSHSVIACLDRVKRLSGASVHAVVVDNASSDGSVEAIARAHPEVTLLCESTNRGFAGGVNRGLAEAARRDADYAWLLNDDTEFDATVLATLLDHAERHPDTGLLSPTLIDIGPSGSEQFGNGLIDWHRGVMTHNLAPERYRRMLSAGATQIVAGTALLCDLRVYRSIGPFDERFFAYWEDTDYSVRALRAGFGVAVVAAAVVRHAATPTRNARPPHYHYHMVRNEALFLHLHAGSSTRWKRRWLAASLEWLAQNRDLGQTANAHACIDGLWHAIRQRWGPRDAHRPAPRWASRLLLGHPYLWFDLVNGDAMKVCRRLVGMT